MKVKRLLSALLCLVMLLGILPVSASAAGKITSVRVENIGVPIDYETLKTDYTVPYNEEYEKDSYYSTVRWTRKEGISEVSVAPGHMVQPGATYCAYITLHSKDDTKPFDPSVNCDLNFVYGDGKKVGDKWTDRKLTLRRDNMELEIKLTFPAITIYDYTYELTNKPGKTHGMPKVGEHPWSGDDICSAIQESQLSAILATWYKVQGGAIEVNTLHSFEKGRSYILELEIRDGPGAIIETGTSITYYDDATGLFMEGKINSSGKVTYLFTPIDPLIPEAVINGFTYPTVGATVESATNAWPGADTFEMVSQEWYRVNTLLSPSETFTAPASYRCALTIRPRSGYKFDSTTTVKVKDYSGNEIGITSTTLLTDGSLQIWTESIPISAKVDTVYVDNFMPPAAGRSIAATYPSIYNSTAKITDHYWLIKNSAGYERVDSGVFEAGETYYQVLEIGPKSGYTFDASTKVYVRYGDLSELPVTLDYCHYVTESDQFVVYTEDLVCRETIDEVTLTGFEYPVVGEMSGMPAIYLKKPDGSPYGFYDAYWYEDGVRIKSTDRFQAGKNYELYVRLSADDGYTFYSSDSYNPLYAHTELRDNYGRLVPLQWTGAMYKAIGFERGTLDWKFYTEPMKPIRQIDEVTFELDDPVTGQLPDYLPTYPNDAPYYSANDIYESDPEWNTEYHNDIMWDYMLYGDKFASGDHFFHIVITAKNGYHFNPDVDRINITFNGHDIHDYNYYAEVQSATKLSLQITPDPSNFEYEVSFSTEHGIAPPAQMVKNGQTATEPEPPTEEGWTFEGWYPTLSFNTKYDFSTPVTESFTLYAKWSELQAIPEIRLSIEEPRAGEKPGKFLSGLSDPYTLDVLYWYLYESPYPQMGPQDTFVAGKIYSVRLRLRAKTGYLIDDSTKVYVNGVLAPIRFSPDPGDVEFQFVIPQNNPFVDVKEGAFYYDAVLWAVNATPQITAGTDKTHFSPNATCTRAQIVTFLWRAYGCQAPSSTVCPFNDVKTDAYYYDAVLWAVEKGITNGVSTTKFGTNDPCKREHAVTFLWRAEGGPMPGSSVNPFTDVKSGAYYYDAVLWAVENGVTNGTSATTFSPAQNCKRSEIVTFLYRAMTG